MNCQSYPAMSDRGYVRENKEFVPYFRSATPERGKPPFGFTSGETSPNRRRRVTTRHSVEFCLDAKPSDAPRLAGAGTALQKVVEDGKQSELEAMCRDWPFFSTRLGMLEMVFAKARPVAGGYDDQRLVDKALWPLGKDLRNLQEKTSKWCWRLPTIPI
ncbi:phosphoenolpyruvate carboxylase [Shigella flexneri]